MWNLCDSATKAKALKDSVLGPLLHWRESGNVPRRAKNSLASSTPMKSVFSDRRRQRFVTSLFQAYMQLPAMEVSRADHSL